MGIYAGASLDELTDLFKTGYLSYENLVELHKELPDRKERRNPNSKPENPTAPKLRISV